MALFFKNLYRGILIFCGIILTYFIMALICSNIVFSGIETNEEISHNEVYITSNGVHTSFILPYKEFYDLINVNDFEGYNNQEYIMIGWGDEDFYMNVPEWEDLTVKVALTSTLWPTNSAMHITFVPKPFLEKDTKKISLPETHYQLLVKSIKNSFLLEQKKALIYPDKGYSDRDNFYRAKGSYHAFNTCNSWTNRMMKEAKLKHVLWTPFPFTVMNLCD